MEPVNFRRFNDFAFAVKSMPIIDGFEPHIAQSLCFKQCDVDSETKKKGVEAAYDDPRR